MNAPPDWRPIGGTAAVNIGAVIAGGSTAEPAE
jgi:hypothetical protein